MSKFKFNKSNVSYGIAQNNIFLEQIGEKQYLCLEDATGNLVSKIEVLGISKMKQLTNFFYRGFNMPLENYALEDIVIPEEKLMECERKVLVLGSDSSERVNKATNNLKKYFNAEISRDCDDYQRTMVYLDTRDKELASSNRIFRLTEERNVVKATMHIDNNLSGDKKRIIKFFFNNTTLPEVIEFFNKSLSLVPITEEVLSRRTEYVCENDSKEFEVSLDTVEDENGSYYSFEFECDNFPGGKEHDSKAVDNYMQGVAGVLELGDCKIVDKGTEDIYEIITGVPFFERFKVKPLKNVKIL